jgi:hypothetical protein
VDGTSLQAAGCVNPAVHRLVPVDRRRWRAKVKFTHVYTSISTNTCAVIYLYGYSFAISDHHNEIESTSVTGRRAVRPAAAGMSEDSFIFGCAIRIFAISLRILCN